MKINWLFNTARTAAGMAALPASAKPRILVDAGDGVPSRGDVHGIIGLAQHVAHRLEGEYHYVDKAVLADMFPAIQGYRQQFAAYNKTHPTADIVFKSSHTSFCDLDYGPQAVSFCAADNEHYLKRYMPGESSGLVPHHVTQDTLKTAGAAFNTQHPDLQRPLIAVMVAESAYTRAFVRKLDELCRDMKGGTIFVCTSWRTSDETYEALMRDLNQTFQSSSSYDMRVTGYHLNGNQNGGNINPYTGLVAEADHLCLIGHSRSMISEMLMSGKAVHTYGQKYPQLEKSGMTIDLLSLAADARLESHEIDPPDITARLAEAIVEEYKKKRLQLPLAHHQLQI